MEINDRCDSIKIPVVLAIHASQRHTLSQDKS